VPPDCTEGAHEPKRISLNAAIGIDGPPTVNQVIEEIAGARHAGYGAAWVPQMPPWPGIARGTR
jgi:hypothetical protein